MTQQKWYQQPAVQIYSLIAFMLLVGHVSGTLEKRRWQRESEELEEDYERRCQEWQKDCRIWVKDNLASWLKSERGNHDVPLEYLRYCKLRRVDVTQVSLGERIVSPRIFLFDGELVVDGKKFKFSVKVRPPGIGDLRVYGREERTIEDLVILESKD